MFSDRDDSEYVSGRPAPPRGNSVSGWVLVLLLGIIVALLYRYRTALWMDLHDPRAAARAVTPRGDLSAAEKTQIEIFEQAAPSVVHITAVQSRQLQGTGTGFVWSQDGYIVTNYHVIDKGTFVRVTLPDSATYDASFVGGEISSDIAVLKISAEPGKLIPIPIGTSADLKVGQNVYAIGSPFGLDQTLTAGVISGLGRQIEALDGRPIENVIQTDAAINPGNSGGPLLDSSGRAVGVNTAIYSPSGTNAGVGFSIPIDAVNRIVPELIRNGSVPHPSLGIIIADLTLAPMQKRGATEPPEKGVRILQVLEGSAAERAGLRGPDLNDPRGGQDGDVIVGIDNTPVDTAKDLRKILDQHQVGDTVEVSILRDGTPLQVKATLQDRPGGPPPRGR